MACNTLICSVSFAEPEQEVPIKATITESRYLPPEMYGQWSVNAYLIGTNAPDLFPSEAHDIWILQETDGQVSVSNPVTGAVASVNVDQVKETNCDVAGHRGRVLIPRAALQSVAAPAPVDSTITETRDPPRTRDKLPGRTPGAGMVIALTMKGR